MQLATSTDFQNNARSLAKVIRTKVFTRVVDNYTGSVAGYTGWTDVTTQVAPMQNFKRGTEYKVGAFKADSMEITGRGVDFWEGQFTLAAGEDLEVKVEIELGQNETFASDKIIAFSGIASPEVTYSELADKASFTVYSLQEVLGRKAALGLGYQNSGPKGLTQPAMIPGLTILDTLSALPLGPGDYSLQYSWTEGTASIGFGGFETQEVLSTVAVDTDVTLYDTADVNDASQGVRLRIHNPLLLPQDTRTSRFIVTEGSGGQPKIPFTATRAKNVIQEVSEAMGVTSWSFTEETQAAYDYAGNASQSVILPLGYPLAEAGETVSGSARALCSDGTSLWIGAGNKLVKREDDSTGSLVVTFPDESQVIDRIFNDQRRNQLWIISHRSGIHSASLIDLDIDETIQVTFPISSGSGSTHPCGTLFVDMLHPVGGRIATGLIVAQTGGAAGGDVVFYTSSSAATRLVDGTTLSSNITHNLAMTEATQSDSAPVVWFQTLEGDSTFDIHRGDFNSIGGWTDRGADWTDVPGMCGAVISPGAGGSATFVTYVTGSAYEAFDSGTLSPLVGLWNTTTVGKPDLPPETNGLGIPKGYLQASPIFHESGASLHSLIRDPSNAETWEVSGVQSTGYAVRRATNASIVPTPIDAQFPFLNYAVDLHKGDLVWMTPTGRLVTRTASFKWTTDVIDTTGTYQSILNNIAKAFVYGYTINSLKQLLFYPRVDISGALRTSGHTLSLEKGQTNDITKKSRHIRKADYVTVSNGVASTTYDGTTFDLAPTAGEYEVKLTSKLIPTALLKNVSEYLYALFSSDRDLYRVVTALYSRFEFEPHDNLNANLTTTKIELSLTGDGYPMHSVTYSSNGSMTIEVIL